MDEYFKSVPVSEHRSLAMKWVGSGHEFINFDLISDPVLLTKYNAMVHKAHHLKRAEVSMYAWSILGRRTCTLWWCCVLFMEIFFKVIHKFYLVVLH